MKKLIGCLLSTGVLVLTSVALAENTATNPVPREAKWVARHEGFVAQARCGGVEVLFLGDSITDSWRNCGSNVWKRFYEPRHAANFGIKADRTQHLLWRIENGELEGIKPKVVVLLIGTNNTGNEKDSGKPRNSPLETIAGVTAVVNAIRAKLPESKILLLAIFPRADNGPTQQVQINEINAEIARLADGKYIRFLDINASLLSAGGVLTVDVMPDLLHPSEKGYQLWAAAMEPALTEMLGIKRFKRPVQRGH